MTNAVVELTVDCPCGLTRQCLYALGHRERESEKADEELEVTMMFLAAR